MQFDFLGLPLEIRAMVYDLHLPHAIRLRKQNNSELVILRTSKRINQEVLWVLRQRHSLSLELLDQTSYLRTFGWLDRLGDDLASNIRSLEIGAWLEVDRTPHSVYFRWLLLSFAFDGGSPGFTIKYTVPDFMALWRLVHNITLCSSTGLCQHLKTQMTHILGARTISQSEREN